MNDSLIIENINHSDGTSGSNAQGKTSGSLTFFLPTTSMSLLFVCGSLRTIIDIAGPYTGSIVDMNDVVIIDGLFFSKPPVRNINVGFINLIFDDLQYTTLKTLTEEAATIWSDIVDYSIFSDYFTSVSLPDSFLNINVSFQDLGDLSTIAVAWLEHSFVITKESIAYYNTNPPPRDEALDPYLLYTTDEEITGFVIPKTGGMILNTQVINNYSSDNIRQVVLHEMGHVLGLGSNWGLFDAHQDTIVNNIPTVYKGGLASREWQRLGGTTPHPPIEQDGGAGTSGVHWDETVFDTELMTGYVDASMPLSKLTACALADQGLKINFDSQYIDSFILPQSALAGIKTNSTKKKCCVHAHKHTITTL